MTLGCKIIRNIKLDYGRVVPFSILHFFSWIQDEKECPQFNTTI